MLYTMAQVQRKISPEPRFLKRITSIQIIAHFVQEIQVTGQGVSEPIVSSLQGDCQIPGLDARGQDLAILGEPATVGLFLPQGTRQATKTVISTRYEEKSSRFIVE
jgi:hypothetical protein